MNKPELLAPAGDMERLKIAFKYGADAVYIGGSMFSLRANAINFTIDEIREAVDYAHNINKKIYVTVNISLHNKEINGLKEYLKELDKIGVDAIIISDPAVLKIARDNTNLVVHLSTQQSTMNVYAAEFWRNAGIKRIVLARENTRDNIEEIIKNVDIEIECFIHGAMCAGISGRCVLSNYFTGRDANRGGCAQVCRWNFDLFDDSNNEIKGDNDFTFCAKDLSMLKYIPDMIDLGITSFKIEGRMRSSYYIATITSIYRHVIDEYCDNRENFEYNKEYQKILDRCANRESITQFFNGVNDHSMQYYNGRMEVSNQDFLGIVLEYDEKEKMATIEQRNYFKIGDKAEIFGPGVGVIKYTFSEIYDEFGKLITEVNHPKQIVKIKVSTPVYKDDMIRKIAIDKDTKV